MEFSIGGKQIFFGIYYASINCTVATVESSRSKKYFCRKEQKKKKKKKKEENEVPGIVLAGKFSFHFHPFRDQ